MNRLTNINRDVNGSVMCYEDDTCNHQCDDCNKWNLIAEKLKEYEDTGLEPSEVKQLKADNAKLAALDKVQQDVITELNAKNTNQNNWISVKDYLENGKSQNGIIKFLNGMFKICWIKWLDGDCSLCTFSKECEVIGNIFDNPKLLEVSQ